MSNKAGSKTSPNSNLETGLDQSNLIKKRFFYEKNKNIKLYK
jgi:hypothetical protein